MSQPFLEIQLVYSTAPSDWAVVSMDVVKVFAINKKLPGDTNKNNIFIIYRDGISNINMHNDSKE